MARKIKRYERITMDEVFAMLREAGLTQDPAFECGMGKGGTLSFAGGVVGFRGDDGFYSRAEVCRFIGDRQFMSREG